MLNLHKTRRFLKRSSNQALYRMCENEYEAIRRRNILEHEHLLASLGLVSADESSNLRKNSAYRQSIPLKTLPKKSFRVSLNNTKRISLPSRRSTRLTERNGDSGFSDSMSVFSDDAGPHVVKPPLIKRPNSYGHIEGVKVGTWWLTRMECSSAGIHRPTVSGIHGGPEGAYSIALSGNYEDDVDYGDHFTYTGSGGRDLKGTKANPKNLRTAPQTKDQRADGFNGTLIASVETKNPVRVIRGYKLDNEYSPEEGYRYDGLYMVEKYWTCIGLSGFLVYKFALTRCKEQDPAPWDKEFCRPNNSLKNLFESKIEIPKQEPIAEENEVQNTSIANTRGRRLIKGWSELKIKLETENDKSAKDDKVQNTSVINTRSKRLIKGGNELKIKSENLDCCLTGIKRKRDLDEFFNLKPIQIVLQKFDSDDVIDSKPDIQK